MTKTEKLKILQDKIKECVLCPALVENRIQTVFGDGNPDSGIVIVGEGPGKNEAEQGIPFCGKSGELLTNILSGFGLTRTNVYIMNVVKCRPPENRAPTPVESSNCRQFFDLQLKVLAPKIILCLGNVASQHVLKEKRGVGSLRGRFYKIEEPIDALVLCSWHPAYLLRNPPAKADTAADMELLMQKKNLWD